MSRTSTTIPGRPPPPAPHLRTLYVFAVFLLFFAPLGCAKHEVRYSTPSLDPVAARNALKSFYHNWKGVPYRVGGMSQAEIDCSGLAVRAYRDVFDVNLPRTVEEQARFGRNISRNSLQPGDLVFFKTGYFQRHVGIFLEEDTFMHASASKGVMLSRLDEPYWRKNFWKAERVYGYSQTARR